MSCPTGHPSISRSITETGVRWIRLPLMSRSLAALPATWRPAPLEGSLQRAGLVAAARVQARISLSRRIELGAHQLQKQGPTAGPRSGAALSATVLRAAASEGPAVLGGIATAALGFIGLIPVSFAQPAPRHRIPFAMASLLARWHRRWRSPRSAMAGADSPGRLAVLQLAAGCRA